MEQTTEYQEVKGNREVKSSLFAKIFSDKKELLELFNAVNGTEHQDTDELEINTIEGILYMTTKNDVSFLIDSAMNLCEVRMLNINYGHNKELMEKSQRLKEYAIFVDKLRKYAKEFPNRLELTITKAIDECIAENVLKDFLMEKKSEVLEMLDDLFDKELYEKDLKQIAFEEGEQIGLEKGEQIGEQNKLISQVQKKLQRGKSVEEIADALEESIETIQSIIDSLQ